MILALCYLFSSVRGMGAQADLIVLGLHGQVADYNSTSGTIHLLTDATLGRLRRDIEEVVAEKGALEVDCQTTLTLYVVPANDDKLGVLRPYGQNPQYPQYPKVDKRSNGYYRGTLFDRAHRTLVAIPTLMANLQPTTGTLPIIADYFNGQTTQANPRDCVFTHDNYSLRPFPVRSNAQMATAYATCAAQIVQTIPCDVYPDQGWQTWGVSRRLACYRALEESLTTATVNLTSATLGIAHGHVLNQPLRWGPTVTTVGGTSATAYVFVDRATSACTFLRHDDYSEPYTFDEAVGIMRSRRWIRPFLGQVKSVSGIYDFYLRQDHVVVETQVDAQMRLLYADRTHAYFAKRVGENEYIWDTSRSNELYCMSLSPQGCGQLERLSDLPFPPLLMFRIPWEDLHQ
jgi:hypothetical protein